jgi:transposase
MVLLTMKDQQRIEVIQGVMGNQIDIEEAQGLLGRSERQIYQMLVKLREKGIKGLVHGNRGKVSPRRLSDKQRDKIIDLAGKKYKGFNDTHMQEKLEEEEGISISRVGLRNILRGAGIKPKQAKRRSPYRSRRERKRNMGMMIQIDASDHDWPESRGPLIDIVGGIDDATNHVWADFADSETTWAYLELVRDIIVKERIPLSLYSDRHTIFHTTKIPTVIEQLQNKRNLTQFGRAMNELGIKLIKAYSPQAKGRIERLWRTFQDRLIAEMRLANICTKEEARKFLKDFLARYNKKFSIPAKDRKKVFRKRPRTEALDRILCLKETRVVNKDHTISFEGLALQIPPSSKWASISRSKVDVLQLRDGSIEIIYKNMTVN